MREIKFRAWDKKEKKLCLVSVLNLEKGGFLLGNSPTPIQWIGDKSYINEIPDGHFVDFEDMELMQFTGLHDKNGKEIYEGDVVRWRNPYRTTQTHTGDNIPNGSYTEPMEPGIKIHEGDVQFKEGGFVVMNDDHDRFDEGVLIQWCGQHWTLEDIREAISYGRPDRFMWDDPEEGDLPYLIKEVAKVKDENELIEYLKGIEVIGNIYENPELIKSNTHEKNK